MLPSSSSVSQIQQYIRAQQGVIEVARTTPDELLLTVGERVQATVTGQLPNGRFAVLVKDQLLDLNLPSNTQPGEQLELVVASKDPRLSFTLTQQAPNPGTASKPAGVSLSSTARLLGELTAESTPHGQDKVATLQQAQPLFEGEPVPEKMATVLAGRLAESGLFYESHQAAWVKGERPLQSLLVEPQARLPVDAEPLKQPILAAKQLQSLEEPLLNDGVESQAAKASSLASSLLADDLNTTSSLAAEREQVVKPDSASVHRERVPSPAMQTEKSVVGHSLSQPTMHPRSLAGADALPDQMLVTPRLEADSGEQGVRNLVQQQLALLEDHPLVWQGQAWPGQPMRWETELQNEGSHALVDDAASPVWKTRLDMNLPNLGGVTVLATLRGGQFELHFEAENPVTVDLLRQRQADLSGRFDAAGLALASTQVHQHVDEADK